MQQVANLGILLMKKAFSLIELLIVILLIGITYGIYFYTYSPNVSQPELKIRNLKEFLNFYSKEHGDILSLICDSSDKICYLLNKDEEVIDNFVFEEDVVVYTLKEKEYLEPIYYNDIELDGNRFEPSLIFKRIGKELFTNLIILKENDDWIYISPYFDDEMNTFINQEEIITYIKKRDYLPVYAGIRDE